ncbi:MAG: hypothetical protein ACRDTR_00920 [Rubrobacter sp.]
MDAGEQTTGTRDEQYNLASALYDALQGADTCDQYALDAEGKQELAGFYRTAQKSHTEIAEQAKKLLGIYTDKTNAPTRWSTP